MESSSENLARHATSHMQRCISSAAPAFVVTSKEVWGQQLLKKQLDPCVGVLIFRPSLHQQSCLGPYAAACMQKGASAAALFPYRNIQGCIMIAAAE
eukprot:1158796-Pelagomonas_calceolata.AAC.6